MSVKYTVAGKTDIGLVRSGNEDNYRIVDDHDLIIVCDGMGGHQAGEVASEMACEIVSYGFTGLADQIGSDSRLALPVKLPVMGDLLVKSIRLASRSIFLRAEANPDQSGMGTTIVSAVFEGNMIGIAHAGDSRAYKMTENELIQMTGDHSWIAELQRNGMYDEMKASGEVNKNVITRALGVHEGIEIDYRLSKIKPGEIYIFCSDGLCGFAEDEIIFRVAKSCDGNVQKICDTLVQLANERGGQDNVTVIALRIDEVDGEPQYEEIEPVTVTEETEEVLLREDELAENINKIMSPSQEDIPPTDGKSSNLLFFLIIFAMIVIVALIILAVIK